MHPLVVLFIPSPTGGNDMEMGIVLATATVGLNHHDIAPFERLTTDAAEKVIQTLGATWHQRTEQVLGSLGKRGPKQIRHGQYDMAVDGTVVQHLADLAHPVIDMDFGTA